MHVSLAFFSRSLLFFLSPRRRICASVPHGNGGSYGTDRLCHSAACNAMFSHESRVECGHSHALPSTLPSLSFGGVPPQDWTYRIYPNF